MSYAALGQDCPPDEMWDDSIGACVCLPGLVWDNFTSRCLAPGGPLMCWPTEVWIEDGCDCKPGLVRDRDTMECVPEGQAGTVALSKRAPGIVVAPSDNMLTLALATFGAGILVYIIYMEAGS